MINRYFYKCKPNLNNIIIMAKGSKVIDLFSNMHVEKNDSKKYSVAIKKIIEHFQGDFTEDFFDGEILEFAINAWNLALMKEIVPAKGFEAILAESEGFMQKENTVLQQIITYKSKHFGAFDRFILDYELLGEEDDLRLQVITQDKEDFIADMMLALEENDEDMDEGMEDEEGYINRSALMLTPKPPFLEWLKSLDIELDGNDSLDSSTYLLDENIGDLDKWLQKKFDIFFKMELAEWHPVKKDWPMKRTYKMFTEWFVVSRSTAVYDMVRERIFKDF